MSSIHLTNRLVLQRSFDSGLSSSSSSSDSTESSSFANLSEEGKNEFSNTNKEEKKTSSVEMCVKRKFEGDSDDDEKEKEEKENIPSELVFTYSRSFNFDGIPNTEPTSFESSNDFPPSSQQHSSSASSSSSSFSSTNSLEAELHSLISQRNQLTTRLLTTEDQLIDVKAENEQLQEKLADLEFTHRKRISCREEEVDELQEEMLRLEQKLEEFKRREVQTERVKVALMTEVEQLRKQICAQESALERLSALEEENTGLKNALGRASELLNNFELSEQEVSASLQAKDETIRRLCGQLEELLEMMEQARKRTGQQILSSASLTSLSTTPISSPSSSSSSASSAPPLPPKRPTPPFSRQQRTDAAALVPESYVDAGESNSTALTPISSTTAESNNNNNNKNNNNNSRKNNRNFKAKQQKNNSTIDNNNRSTGGRGFSRNVDDHQPSNFSPSKLPHDSASQVLQRPKSSKLLKFSAVEQFHHQSTSESRNNNNGQVSTKLSCIEGDEDEMNTMSTAASSITSSALFAAVEDGDQSNLNTSENCHPYQQQHRRKKGTSAMISDAQQMMFQQQQEQQLSRQNSTSNCHGYGEEVVEFKVEEDNSGERLAGEIEKSPENDNFSLKKSPATLPPKPLSLLEELHNSEQLKSSQSSSLSPPQSPNSPPKSSTKKPTFTRHNSIDICPTTSLSSSTLSPQQNQQKTSSELPTNSKDNSPFPSLPDVMLRKLQLLGENTTAIESLSEAEIEAKFQHLSLAFKTDKFTLEARLNRCRHQREVIEADTAAEVRQLATFIHSLNESLFSSSGLAAQMSVREFKAALDRLEAQCAVVGSALRKVASRSELYGAVRQEERMSAAFDVVLLHLEHLKRAKEKEEKEVEDLKRLLSMSDKTGRGSLGHCGLPISLPSSVSGVVGGELAGELVQQLIQRQESGDLSCGGKEEVGTKRRAFRSISGVPANTKINLIRVRRASVASIDLGSTEVFSRRSAHQLGYDSSGSPTHGFTSNFRNTELLQPSPVTTTTTTTTTFPNGPLGQPTTCTTITTSKSSSKDDSEETTEEEVVISTVTEPLLTSLNSQNLTDPEIATPQTPLLEGSFPPFDSLTLRTTKGGRRLSVPVSDLAFRGPSTPYQRPKLFSFLNDSPSFFGLQEEDGESGGHNQAGEKTAEELEKSEGDLKENGGTGDQIIIPEDEDDEDISEVKNEEQNIDDQSTSISTSFDDTDHHQVQQRPQPPPPRSILKKAQCNARRFFAGDLVRLLRIVPVEGGLVVTLLYKRGLAKWRWAVETIRLKTEDVFEQLVVKSLTKRSPILFERITSHRRYDQFRFLLSGLFVFISLVIVVHSILLPLLF